MNTKRFLISLGAGFLGALIVLGLVLVFVFFKPNTTQGILSHFEGLKNQNILPDLKEPKTLDKIFATDTDLPKTFLPKIVQKLSVTDVVKKANPAVVSVIITQDVPKYEIVQNGTPNSNIFDPFGVFNQFSAPIYRQNGTEKKNIGGGSGFLISSDGYIITNKHVVANTNAEYTVQLLNGKKYPTTVIARDAVLDIGVLKITGSGFSYLNLGDSDKLEIGEQVVAIGNALAEFQNSVSQGIISGLGRNLTASNGSGGVENLDKVIQTDVAINPGNSGGPLLNMNGDVIGVNVAVAQGSQSIGFALPINTVKSIVKSILKTGTISRPYVGIRYVQINGDLQKKLNLSVDYGILIRRGQNESDVAIIPGSPADIAGLKENDIILAVDGKKLTSDDNFAILIRGKNVGDTISLKILSNGVEKTVQVKLALAS